MPRLGRRKRNQGGFRNTPALELVLAMWEDYWRVMDLENQMATAAGTEPMYAREGALINAPRFRDFLLSLLSYAGKVSVEPFFGKEIRAPAGMNVDAVAVELATWCWKSRRIYSIDTELQALLAATSLKDVIWDDIRLPFDSFGIQLAQPICMTDGTKYDFVLISRHMAQFQPSKEIKMAVLFILFSTKRNEYMPLTQSQLNELQALIQQRKWRKADTLRYKLQLHILRCLEDFGVVVPEDEIRCKEVTCLAAYLMEQHASELSERRASVAESTRAWDEMFRVVVGLALYLQTLPPGSPHVSPPSTPFRSGLPDRKVITNRWEVCNVTSVIPLTREERIFYGIEGNLEQQRQAKHELSCHFREGHWRRPPGKGDDPTAPRTVHVRPCIVRRDRLPKDGGLPGGAIKGDATD